MIRNHTLGILILILIGLSTFVSGTNLYLLYENNFTEYRARLSQLATTQSHIINAIARYDEKYGDRMHPEGATTATLNKIIAALKQYRGFGKTGEIVVARLLENRIMYVYTQRESSEDLELILMDSEGLEPMKRALQGDSGTMLGTDYRGQIVLAAFQHIPLLSLGLVVKVNKEEIQQPFIRTAIISSIVATIAIAVGSLLFYYFGNPLVRKLERYSEDLENEVIERTENLKIANSALAEEVQFRKKAEAAKDDFVSTVSHELRTPLTAILGSMGLIKGGVTGTLPEKAARMIEIAHSNGERLLRLIDNVLDIEKMEAGRIELHLAKIDFAELVRSSVEVNQEFARKYNVVIEITDKPEKEIIVNADSDKIIQVITNLLSNAVKYSPENDKVTVSFQLNADTVRLNISDNGSGIPEDFKAKIFSKFSQADTSTTKEKGGTGLGLSIARALVKNHKGKIGFESESGKGTTFYFELPVIL